MNNKYYNVHTHKKPHSINEVCIRNAYLTPIERFEPNYFLSTGIHPWHVAGISTKELMIRLEKNCNNMQVKAIGEIGLDKYANDYEKQLVYFELQLDFAAQFHYPVILHQVKSVEGVGSVIKNFHEPIILHGFNSHISVWEQLNSNGKTYISVGSNCLNPSAKLLQTLKDIPLKNLFLETDNAAVLVQTVYEKIASIREIETSKLMEEMATNFKSVFKTEN